MERYDIPALPGSAPNHIATSFLSNTIPACHIANADENACMTI